MKKKYKLYRNAKEILALPWRKTELTNLPRTGGLYMLIDPSNADNNIDYIGRAANLYVRMHAHHKFDRNKHEIYFIAVEDADVRMYLENEAIRLVPTNMNQKRGSIPADALDTLLRQTAALIHIPHHGPQMELPLG